jgi:hypothetical protein
MYERWLVRTSEHPTKISTVDQIGSVDDASPVKCLAFMGDPYGRVRLMMMTRRDDSTR